MRRKADKNGGSHEAKGKYAVILLAGFALGAGVIQGLHAQAGKTPAYAVAEVEVTDPPAYQAYLAKAINSLKPYNAHIIVRAKPDVKEGPTRARQHRHHEFRQPGGRRKMVQHPALQGFGRRTAEIRQWRGSTSSRASRNRCYREVDMTQRVAIARVRRDRQGRSRSVSTAASRGWRSPRFRRATSRAPKRRWPTSPGRCRCCRLARLWRRGRHRRRMRSRRAVARDRRAGARPRPARHGAELRRAARQFRPRRPGAPARRPHPRPLRGAVGPRCGRRRRRRRHLDACT